MGMNELHLFEYHGYTVDAVSLSSFIFWPIVEYVTQMGIALNYTHSIKPTIYIHDIFSLRDLKKWVGFYLQFSALLRFLTQPLLAFPP